MSYQLFIAFRYLRAKRKQTFTTVITIISVLGIAIGVMALVVALSLMTGMHTEIKNRILGSRAHITVWAGSSERVISDFETVREDILAIDGVIAAAPMVREMGLISSRAANEGVFAYGINPEETVNVVDVFEHIIFGDAEDLTKRLGQFKRRGVLIGEELARKLLVSVGDDLILQTTSTGTLSPVGYVSKPMKLRVAAIFRTGDWQADSHFCYLPLEYMQQALKLGNGRTYMQVKLEDMYRAQEYKEIIEDKIGSQYIYSTWIEENSMFFNALELEKLAMFLAITLIITVAALNIVSTLIMLVMEKNRDIGILRSMGASQGGVMLTFILQGLIIGLIGTLLGAALGSALSWALDAGEVIKLPGEVYMITTVRFMLVPLDILMVCLVALGISVLATIYPAWKASRLRPAEALRYE